MDKCPKCGAELRSPNAPHRGWVCGSYEQAGNTNQSYGCRIRELESENRDLIALIDDLTDGEPCLYANDRCLTHWRAPRPCPHERAAAVLDAQLNRVEEAERGKD